ncbi:DUF4097 family beta strand repeat-containing protein [Lentibacillus sp. CBA3610]|uniref:DUF4097 family beta strand repeat-containing protein n=1 Tax=Lentibacillus sp. CBA3610 TaxID=2518176 RepID=UPI0015960E44|nr:DUF4097 family beta strand repeat-containing protein [Lentibacillus sp. CBA3610]QKY71495.1 hypothetical protein Len3610_19850 [Lentibacillus sp. CBA3610]
MKSIKKMSVIALILLLVGVGGSLIAFNLMDKSNSSEEQVIDPENIENIEINTNNEKVELISTNDSNIKVELAGTRMNDIEDRLEVKTDGNTLSIQTVRQKGIFNINLFGETLALTVYLPEKLYESLQAELDNGSFQASQLNIKEIQVKTNNGRIEMGDINSDQVYTNSDNGGIKLDHVEGNISGQTNNGSISLYTNHLDRSIELESDNGNIEIETEKDPTNAVFDVKTDNGTATIFGSSNWDTIVGDGDNLIKLTTNNGNIDVMKQ